jgi:hypothetical protein
MHSKFIIYYLDSIIFETDRYLTKISSRFYEITETFDKLFFFIKKVRTRKIKILINIIYKINE